MWRARTSKTSSLVAMTCWQAAENVDGAVSVGDLEEVWSNVLHCLRQNASSHVVHNHMEQDVQWVLDELGMACEQLCQMTDRATAQVKSERLRELFRAARHDSNLGDPRRSVQRGDGVPIGDPLGSF